MLPLLVLVLVQGGAEAKPCDQTKERGKLQARSTKSSSSGSGRGITVSECNSNE